MRTTWTSDEVMRFCGEVEARAAATRDYLVRLDALRVGVGADGRALVTVPTPGGSALMAPTRRCRDQLADACGIPRAYFERCAAKAPELAGANANRWLSEAGGQRMLLRAIDDRARALVSDSYRIIDSWDVLTAALGGLGQERAEVLRGYASDERIALTAIRSDITETFRDGRGTERALHPGVRVENDETGGGSLRVQAFVFDRACTNGSVFGARDVMDAQLRCVHVTSRANVETLILSPETRRRVNAAILGAVGDTVHAMFSPATFARIAARMRAAAGEEIKAPDEAVVEVVGKELGFSEEERRRVLEAYVAACDRTQFGLSAAINRWSVIGGDGDARIDEFEAAAGKVLEKDRAWIDRLEAEANRVAAE